ncbi:MAG: hypothetical protein OXM61_15045 [Candidatus Poribacteria bacterium]|nr:hypothetical protein [Candidatus Poribacteria bacterium]
MYKNFVSFIGTQNVLKLNNKTLWVLVALIFTACFTIGCDNVSTREVLDLFSTVDLNRTVTVTLDEKNGSGITGEATFAEYNIESGTILSFDVKIQNAGPGRKYAAYIYSGDSCETPGSIWDVEAFKAYSFTTDENGIGDQDYTTDLTIDTNSETDILGKVLVIHEQVGSGDLADGTQVSCGVITLTE